MTHVAESGVQTALLRAAEQSFVEHGVAGANVEDIARAAGLPKGAFYRHFESKEAALTQIIATWLARFSPLFAGPSAYPDVNDDVDALLDFWVERDVRIYEFLWDTRGTVMLLQSCGDEYGPIFDGFKTDLKSRTRAWLEQWRKDGLVREDVEPELGAAMISGAHEELTNKMLRGGERPPIDHWVEFAVAAFVRAFGTEELVAALHRRTRRSGPEDHYLAAARPAS
jgi:AcrR family transcriptional regulator